MRLILTAITVLIFFQYGQAEELKGLPKDIMIVVGNNVNVRSEPNVNSKEIAKLDLADKIKIIRKYGKNFKIGDRTGDWYFINTRKINQKTKEAITGWVFSYYLSDMQNFKILDSFRDCILEGSVGDFYFYYKTNKDGSYKRKFFDNGTNKMIIKDGHLYQFRDVIIAHDTDNAIEIFFMSNGNLCSKYVNEKGSICAKCK